MHAQTRSSYCLSLLDFVRGIFNTWHAARPTLKASTDLPAPNMHAPRDYVMLELQGSACKTQRITDALVVYGIATELGRPNYTR